MLLGCFGLPWGPLLNVIVLCILELSLSAGRPQLERRHQDFTSSGSKKLYFDTHALVCLLEENGNPSSLVTQCHRTAPWIITSLTISSNFSYFSLTFKSAGNLLLSLHFWVLVFCWRTFLLHQYNRDFLTHFVQLKCILLTSL